MLGTRLNHASQGYNAQSIVHLTQVLARSWYHSLSILSRSCQNFHSCHRFDVLFFRHGLLLLVLGLRQLPQRELGPKVRLLDEPGVDELPILGRVDKVEL